MYHSKFRKGNEMTDYDLGTLDLARCIEHMDRTVEMRGSQTYRIRGWQEPSRGRCASSQASIDTSSPEHVPCGLFPWTVGRTGGYAKKAFPRLAYHA